MEARVFDSDDLDTEIAGTSWAQSKVCVDSVHLRFQRFKDDDHAPEQSWDVMGACDGSCRPSAARKDAETLTLTEEAVLLLKKFRESGRVGSFRSKAA